MESQLTLSLTVAHSLFLKSGSISVMPLDLWSAHHPQCNVQTEKCNQEPEAALRCIINNNPSSWRKHLIWMDYAHNTSSATGLSPFLWVTLPLSFGVRSRRQLSSPCNIISVAAVRSGDRPRWTFSRPLNKTRGLQTGIVPQHQLTPLVKRYGFPPATSISKSPIRSSSVHTPLRKLSIHLQSKSVHLLISKFTLHSTSHKLNQYQEVLSVSTSPHPLGSSTTTWMFVSEVAAFSTLKTGSVTVQRRGHGFHALLFQIPVSSSPSIRSIRRNILDRQEGVIIGILFSFL